MVAAGAAAATPRLNPSPSPHRRRASSALSPAKSNANANANAADAGDVRPKPKAKAVSSRYLLAPSSKSTSTSTSTSTTTTSSSSNSTSTSASTPSRRFASPLPRRSVSVDRPRPGPAANAAVGEAGGPNAGTTTTTRSLSVAFQGLSFSFETSKAKPTTSPSPSRRPVASAAGAITPERRRPAMGTVPERGKGFEGGQSHHRWPMSARFSQGLEGNPLTKSLDCSLRKRDAAVLAAVRSLRQSMVFEEGVRRSSFDGGDYLMSSDTESVSSGSNSGSQDAGIGISHRARPSPKGMGVPARFLQDAAASRSQRFADPGTPYLPYTSGLAASTRTAPVKKSLLNGFVSSPLNRPIRQSSPSKLTGNPSRRMSSPSRARNLGSGTSSWDHQGRSSSGYGLDGEVRRRWHGGSKVDCEHLLRILSNRHLQWRCVNAQADAALAAQKLTAEKYLSDAWITTLGMRKSVALKRFQLQLYRNNWKLMTVLKGQMAYLEEWSILERDYADSLSGIVEALTASILCLPVTDGAKADIQDVKNAVGSAVDIMQTIGSSICTLLAKLAGTSILVFDLSKVATHERTLMEQSRELLSTLATMHVKYCSLQGQRVQTTDKRSKHS
ncbi:QWRF motif-containing protein 2-like [Panicum miliaceum]|uniref:QWRF motif-containing protein 2-like n=1 Tax=Panicum miliaceum TaxID=4540 RepID=A0A3L6SCS9_PANMI|nr:QWRF motif-containing protein 2-like [Panicum miliaceum]